MTYPYLKVMGSFDSGLIIEADLPSHLSGNGVARRSLVLTPAQSYEMAQQIDLLREATKPLLDERRIINGVWHAWCGNGWIAETYSNNVTWPVQINGGALASGPVAITLLSDPKAVG